jgi:DNA-binding response OmpR family regulator
MAGEKMKNFKIAFPSLKHDEIYIVLIKQTFHELGHSVSFVSMEDETGLQKKTDYDILALEPDLYSFRWLDVLLESRRQAPQTPVILFSLDMTVKDGFLPMPNDPGVFIINDINMLKKNFHKILGILDMSEKRILFVDDDINILRAYERSLRKSSLQIYTIATAEKAMEILRNEQIDLVVTDIKMPGMHGFELISKIREEKRKLPIIICSGYSGMKEDDSLGFHDVAAFFEKPVDMETLEKKIKDILKEAPRED